MARSSLSAKRGLSALLAAATAISGAALLAPGTSSASSHREAPYIQGDPAVDNTDTYAFVSPDDANSVTMIANWWPFEEPAGGPNFFPWDPQAAYDINIDNNGDAKADITYRWTFKDIDRRPTVKNGGADGSILYANGPVTSLTDENLLFRQTYDLTVLRDGAATGTVIMKDQPVAPSNVGVGTIPDYVKLRKEAVRTIDAPAGAGKVSSYVGQADDPFFLDLRIFDLLYGGDLSEKGYDTLSGFNVNTIAYKVPKAVVTANQNPAKNPVIGVWSTTSRKKTRVFADTGAGPTAVNNDNDARHANTESGDFVQVSRLGNPLVNEAVVPAQLKDYFNRSRPEQDGALLGEVQDPEVPTLVEGVYKVPNPNKLNNEAAKKRNDLSAIFLTGFSKKVFAGTTFGGIGKGVLDADLNSLDLNEAQPSDGVKPAEYLRLNVNVPPTQTSDAKFSRLGALGGDLAGYPNGRRLTDDITDETLLAAEGALIGQDKAVLDVIGTLDGVNGNDRPFLNEFPYIADPHTGSDPRVGQTPVMFQQNFTTNRGRVTTNVTRINPPAPGGFVQLYRINADGSSTGLGSMTLDKTGTTSTTKVFPATPGTKVTLNYRVFPKRGSAAQFNRGVPTTITIK